MATKKMKAPKAPKKPKVTIEDFEDLRKDLKFFTKAVAWLVILLIVLMAFHFKWTYDNTVVNNQLMNAVTTHQIKIGGYDQALPSMADNDQLFAEWSKEFSEKVVEAFTQLGILQANMTERIVLLEDDAGFDIGGNYDENGCLAPAGYQWCEATQACQRVWETACE